MEKLIPVHLDKTIIDKTYGLKTTKCPKNLVVYAHPNNWLTRKLWKYLNIKLGFYKITGGSPLCAMMPRLKR